MNNRKGKSQPEVDDEMQPTYDFTGGIRGKHAQAYALGHRVIIYKTDGSIETQEFTLPEGVVLLDPDVQKYFPDAEAVNRALRGLIHLIPQQQTVDKAAA